MRERDEGGLSAFASMIPDDFIEDTGSWYDDIPNMPEAGHGRTEACQAYEHILDAFARAQKDNRQFTPQMVTDVFNADRERMRNWLDSVFDTVYYDPSLDVSLQNVLAVGAWYERDEFENEESSTPRHRMLCRVNSLIRLTLHRHHAQNPPTP